VPVETRISTPFIPQEGVTQQILSAVQLANEHHAQQQQLAMQQQALPSEIAAREAGIQQTAAQAQEQQALAQEAQQRTSAGEAALPGQLKAQELANTAAGINNTINQSRANVIQSINQPGGLDPEKGPIAGLIAPLGELSNDEKAIIQSGLLQARLTPVGGDPIAPITAAVNRVTEMRHSVFMTHERAQATIEAQQNLLTGPGLDLATKQFMAGGGLPTNMRSPALISKIFNRAAEIDPKFNVAQAKAVFDANKGALDKLTSTTNMVEAFSNTAGKNGDMFVAAANHLTDTGSPLLNMPIRAAEKGLVGDTSVTSFLASRKVYASEVAKVLGSVNGTGQTTDAQQKEIDSILSPNATLGQILAATKVLQTDLHNRGDAYNQQIDSIVQQIGQAGKPATGAGVVDPLGILKQ
jgi:hypothetical protein